ncbi:putative septation protein SpoVG [compost metagenome]
MQITDVRLRRVNSEGRMKAIASITIDNEFVVHDIRVIDGNNGMFVAMPSKRTPDGRKGNHAFMVLFSFCPE